MKKQSVNSGGQAEVSVFWVTVKGDEHVVSQALLTAQNIANAGGVRVGAPGLTPKPPTLALPTPASPSASDSVTEFVSPGESTPSPEASTFSEQARSLPRSKPRTFTMPEPMDELRAHESPDSFKEFVGTRSITGFNDRGLTAAIWLREKRDIKQFGIRHLYTCFRMVSWKLPDEPASLLRNMKKSKYVRQVGPGLYELTTIGDNRYQEMD